MEERHCRGRKTLYYAIVIICILLVAYNLYKNIYALIIPNQYYVDLHIFRTTWFVLYNSWILRLLSKIFSVVGIVALFIFWESPKPKWRFILLISAMLLSAIRLGVMSLIIKVPGIWEHTLLLNIIGPALFVIGLVLKWVMIIMLIKKSDKDARPILTAHIVVLR